MTKILNLDEIAPKAEKVLKIKGKSYTMVPATVGSFIRVTRDLQEMHKKEATIADQMDYMCATVAEAFPGMEEDLIKSLTVDQLQAVTAFIQEKVEEEATEAKKPEAAGQK